MLLKPEGVLTLEFPHLLKLIELNEFDTIYHEHFSYFSLLTVQIIFRHHGLEIFDVQELPTHGGSLRIFAKQASSVSNPVQTSVQNLINREKAAGIDTLNYYQSFWKSVNHVKNAFLSFLLTAKEAGKTIAAYGAAAKGNTLLNYCGIKTDLIDFVVDANPAKQNKFLPGSHIPVVKEEMLKIRKPDYVVILPWNIKDEIREQLSYIRDWGGQFVTAIPDIFIG